MHYLYHRIPKNLTGNILYPLNSLKEVFPDVYETEVQKYKGREYILDQEIPLLQCRWNDVLHFSPVHPKYVIEALREAGSLIDFRTVYYEIDPAALEPEKTVIFLYDSAYDDDKMNAANFITYDPSKIVKYSELPQATKDYYRVK